jgi:hypothetical protein
MLSHTPHPPGIPGYNDYRAPTEADARAALHRVFGAERGAERWAQACGACGVPVGRAEGVDRLRRAISTLAEQGGAAAAVARSIEIRLRTHARLAAKSLTVSAGGQG